MHKLEICGLSKTFENGIAALDNINLEISSDDFLVIVGPSGCGKSTLIRTIAGLEEPSSGKILFDEELMNNLSAQERNVGLIFQNYALFPTMTVEQNIGFPLESRRAAKGLRKASVESIADKLHIGSILRKFPHQLSGGEQQRVSIARALVADCEIILCDEPLSSLNPEIRSEIRAELSELHKQTGKLFILVSHDQADALTLASKVCVMKEGSIVQIGTSEEIYNKPANLFVAKFFGTPQINCIPAKLSAKDGHCELSMPGSRVIMPQNESWSMIHEGSVRDVIVGIRPEALIPTEIMPDSKPVSETDSPESISIKGEVKSYTNLGDVLWISAQVDGSEIVFLAQPDIKTSLGEEIALTALTKDIMLFDPRTEMRLDR